MIYKDMLQLSISNSLGYNIAQIMWVLELKWSTLMDEFKNNVDNVNNFFNNSFPQSHSPCIIMHILYEVKKFV